jgi:Icc-related predicted phosphoesterase
MGKVRITTISDTHTKHWELSSNNSILPGGDILIHAGDISNRGSNVDINEFCEWFDSINNYTTKIFIAGNHDFGFENRAEEVSQIVNPYESINYLEDNWIIIDGIKIWGSPWQPEFYDWAFNLPRNGVELQQKWNMIDDDTDILITHGPAWGYVDRVVGRSEHLGCELLTNRIMAFKPKIHICGHIHSGYGYTTNGDTHFINAAVLDERYEFTQNPLTFDWDKSTNVIDFI